MSNSEKKEKTKLDLIKHLIYGILTLIGVVLFTFYIYFPISTNHGESLTVPNLEGMELADLEEFLEDRDLRFEVEPDSSYSPDYPPLAVLEQFPHPNSKVKTGRKIYVTLNATTPPVVKIPDLRGRSLKNAQLALRSLGLQLGERRYKPEFGLNSILNQYLDGKELNEGDEVPKGSKIDFDVADGLGNQTFRMPNLTGLDLEEAVFTIEGNGLKLGDVTYEEEGIISFEKEDDNGNTIWEDVPMAPGRVFKQSPKNDRKAKIGMSVDIWLVQVDTTATEINPTLELLSEEN